MKLPQEQQTIELNKFSMFWLRLLMYIILLWCWPQIVQWLVSLHNNVKAISVNRRPLAILIVCYELLVVQNLLALIIRYLE